MYDEAKARKSMPCTLEARRNNVGYRSENGVKNLAQSADETDYPTNVFQHKNRMAFYRFRYERNASLHGHKTPSLKQSWQVS